MWVIYFDGLFERGYVKHQWFTNNPEQIRFENEADVLAYATKHHFKFAAQFYCWMYNRLARLNYSFRHYEVRKCKKVESVFCIERGRF